MDGMSPAQEPSVKGWHRDDVSLQVAKGPAQPGKIDRIGHNRKVGVPAKLGRAVKHARLSSHE
jgi:hypothetical protein